jgi:anti-sigma regulatory factor (Ser/Thr protein kinase)
MFWSQSVGGEVLHLDVSIPNTPACAAYGRKLFIGFAKQLDLDPEIVTDFETAAGEALANAVEHGWRSGGTIRLEAWLTELGLEAAISDDGPGFAPGTISRDHPDALAPRGYGRFLMQALMDEVEFRNDGKTVWFLKRL